MTERNDDPIGIPSLKTRQRAARASATFAGKKTNQPASVSCLAAPIQRAAFLYRRLPAVDS